jgi:tetratricopeptide (TPR) repeat protein
MTARPSFAPKPLVQAATAALTCGALLWGALTTPALAGGSTVAVSSPAQGSDAEIRADIQYARGLASEWSFVDLASRVLDDARKKNPSGKLRAELGLAECEVYGQGARIERDDTRRNQLFETALDKYLDFIASNSSSDLRAQAEAGLVSTAVNFSQSVDIALENLSGEEAEALKARKVEVLTETVKLTQALVDPFLERSASTLSAKEKSDARDLMLNRGRMLMEIGASQVNGVYFFEQSIKALEEMVFYFGEGEPEALLAYQVMGDVYLKQGNSESAFWMFEGVINQTWPADPDLLARIIKDRVDAKDPISDAEWGQRYLYLELAMPGVLECLTNLGQGEQATAFALHFYNARQQKGLNWSRAGYTALLSCARVLLDAGGWIGGNQSSGEARWFPTEEEMKEAVRGKRNQEQAVSLALKLAGIVNNDNKGSYLQVRAQKLISEIASRPGLSVSIDVLVQAAEGEFHDGNYDEAILGYKRVLAALETRSNAEQLEFGAKAYNFLANCYRRDKRTLEAAVAFKAGLDANPDDPEFTEKNVQGYRAMIKTLSDVAPTDQVLKDLLATAEALVLEKLEGGAAKERIIWNNAGTAKAAEDWDEAIRLYSSLAIDSTYGEKALVEAAVCRFRKGQATVALEALNDYLENYATDPTHAHESPNRKQKRREAMAGAEFFRGYIHYVQARKSGDTEGWKQVDKYLTGFPERYPKQDKLAPLTVRLTMEARLALGDRPGARQMIDTLVSDFKDSSQTAKGAVTFYRTLKDLREAATGEERTALLREMAEFLKIANSIMSPDYGRMRNESLHWMELGEYDDAERALRTVAEQFADDKKRAKTMRSNVLPDLGRVLLANGKVAEAKDVLAPLVLDDGPAPGKTTVLNYCRSVSGWLTGGGPGKPVQETPGAGGSEEEWQAAVDSLNRILASGDKWSPGWYEHRLMQIWTYYSWGQTDSRKLESAKNQLAQFDAAFDKPNYVQIDQATEAEEDPALKARLAGGVLQSRFQYLARKVK